MGYATLHVIQPGGDVEEWKEYHNSPGFAIPIWVWLAERYLGQTRPDWLLQEGTPLFDLRSDSRLEEWERICLWASFHYVIIERDDLRKLTAAFRVAERKFTEKNPGNQCHYGAMANDIQDLSASLNIRGVAFGTNSADWDGWTVNDECTCKCGDIHQVDEERPYNIDKDEKHFSVFKEMEAASPAKEDS